MSSALSCSFYGLGIMAAFLSIASSKYPSSSSSTITFSSKPSILVVRKEDDVGSVERQSLRQLVETRVSSVLKDFRPLWWLFNGHLQTIYSVLGDFSKGEQISYKRIYLQLVDGGTLGLDFAPIDERSNPYLEDSTPIIVVQHGLTGGSHEPYVRAILSRAILSKEKGGLGYRAVVINFRGCAGVPVTSPRFYSAGHTDDTRNALLFIANQYPKAPLLALGFSLGANVLIRYLSEEQENARFHAACALACPWNLEDNNTRLESTFLGKHLYSKGMGSNLQKLLEHHHQALSTNPDHFVAQATTKAMALKNPTIEQFDHAFTAVAGGPPPAFPFPSSHEYYKYMSTDNDVADIRVPFLAINAEDDPIVRRMPDNGDDNPFVVMVLTRGGGHLGWYQAGSMGNIDRWTNRPALEWLKLMGDDVVHNPIAKGGRIFKDSDGWLREEGQSRLGCKEIGDIIEGSTGELNILQGL